MQNPSPSTSQTEAEVFSKLFRQSFKTHLQIIKIAAWWKSLELKTSTNLRKCSTRPNIHNRSDSSHQYSTLSNNFTRYHNLLPLKFLSRGCNGLRLHQCIYSNHCMQQHQPLDWNFRHQHLTTIMLQWHSCRRVDLWQVVLWQQHHLLKEKFLKWASHLHPSFEILWPPVTWLQATHQMKMNKSYKKLENEASSIICHFW